MNTWLGTYGTDAYYNGNWSQNRRPETMDEVRFDGAVSQVNCVGLYRADDVAWDVNNDPMPPRMGEGSYDKIRFINGYTGHVSLGTNLMVYTLELTTGNLDQGYNGGYGTAISVVTRFDWTGGTLNSTEDLSAITLEPGSTAEIAPGEGNTLLTGSSILLADASGSELDGAEATFTAGELLYENNACLAIGQECEVKVIALPDGGAMTMDKYEETDSKIVILIGGYLKVEGGGLYNSKLPLLNDGGSLSIYPTVANNVIKNSKAKFSGTLGTGVDEVSLRMTSGTIILPRHSILEAVDDMRIDGGELTTEFMTDLSVVEGVSRIITPNFIMSGGTVSFLHTNSDRNITSGVTHYVLFEEIFIEGKGYWYGGDLQPYVNNDNNNSDRLVFGQNLYIRSIDSPGCIITPTTVDTDGNLSTDLPNANRDWGVLKGVDIYVWNGENYAVPFRKGCLEFATAGFKDISAAISNMWS